MAIVSVAKEDKRCTFWPVSCSSAASSLLLEKLRHRRFILERQLLEHPPARLRPQFFRPLCQQAQGLGVLIPGFILTTFGGVAILDDLHVDWFRISYLFDYWPLMLTPSASPSFSTSAADRQTSPFLPTLLFQLPPPVSEAVFLCP